jgi:hypothetical protein
MPLFSLLLLLVLQIKALTSHKVDFQNVKVIGRESNFGKRLVLEMTEIRKILPIALNKQIDSQSLGTSYDNLL